MLILYSCLYVCKLNDRDFSTPHVQFHAINYASIYVRHCFRNTCMYVRTCQYWSIGRCTGSRMLSVLVHALPLTVGVLWLATLEQSEKHQILQHWNIQQSQVLFLVLIVTCSCFAILGSYAINIMFPQCNFWPLSFIT